MSNIPGMDYLLRVGTLWNNLLIKQSSEMEKAWSEIKGGNYRFQSACRVWATAVEDYYGAAIDSGRGPGYIPRPAWLYFAYSPTQDSVLAYTARLDRSVSSATTLDTTDFASLDQTDGPTFLLAKDLYEHRNVNGDQIEIVLDKGALRDLAKNKKLSNGQYISFVFGKDQGPQPPLLIVVLSISDCSPVKK